MRANPMSVAKTCRIALAGFLAFSGSAFLGAPAFAITRITAEQVHAACGKKLEDDGEGHKGCMKDCYNKTDTCIYNCSEKTGECDVQSWPKHLKSVAGTFDPKGTDTLTTAPSPKPAPKPAKKPVAGAAGSLSRP